MQLAASSFLLVLALAGCVSTEMRRFVGQDIAEARIRYGEPVAIVDLADGRRAFQFAQGGGPQALPATYTEATRVSGNAGSAGRCGS